MPRTMRLEGLSELLDKQTSVVSRGAYRPSAPQRRLCPAASDRPDADPGSRAWHLSPEDWDRTRQRHDRMAAAGVILLHFSPREIRREPAKVARMIQGAIASGLTRPPLPIRTIPCPSSIQ